MILPAPLRKIARHVAVGCAQRQVADLLPADSGIPRVVIAGSQKQGKSSLINAMLGAPLLPVDSLPATATACLVEWGPIAQAAILDGLDWRAIAFEERARYMDQNLLQNATPPAIVRISYPSEMLASLTLIDTAGTGSVFEGHSQSARGSLAAMDLLVLVCSVHKPLGEDDLPILESARANGTPVVCVVTKADEAKDASDSADALEQTLEFIRSELRKKDLECHDLFAVSAFENDVLGAEFAGSVDALRSHLIEIAARTQVRSLVNRCRKLLEAEVAEAGDWNRLIIATEGRASFVTAAIEEKQGKIAAELSAALLESQRYMDEARHDLYEAVLSARDSLVMALVPEASEVNEPDQIPNAWRILCAKAPSQRVRVVERMRVLLSNAISDGSMRLGLDAGSQSTLASTQAAIDSITLPELELPIAPPPAVLEEPGFLAVTFNLHGRYISEQITKLVRAEFDRSAANELREFGRDKLSQVVRLAEEEAQRKARDASAVVDEDVRQLHSVSVILSDAQRATDTSGRRLRQRINELDEAASTIEGAFSRFEQDEAEVAATLDKLAELEMSEHDRLLLVALSHYVAGRVSAAAQTLTKTTLDEAFHARDIARAYWVCCCRCFASGQPISKSDEQLATLDAVGSAAFALIEACVASARTGQSQAVAEQLVKDMAVGRGLKHLEYACTALLIPAAAGALSSTRLSAFGLPSKFVLLRERLAERIERKTLMPLAAFAAQNAEILAAPEVESDLIERLKSYAQGTTPDPRNLPSLRSYVLEHGWRALAS
jgi:predicted GTPase